MSPRMPTPVELGSLVDEVFRITWSDEHRSRYTWAILRARCPCATCAGEWGYRPPRLRPEDLPPGIRALNLSRVGAYALRFEWSDGHDTGIYTFTYLRHDLCECDECTVRREAAGQV